MRSLIRRLFPMHHDIVPSWRPRHRGNRRPALVRPTEHQGATADWSPLAWAAESPAQPEELPAEAVVREAEEIVDHWAAEYARFEAEVRSWFDELPSIKDDPIAAQLLAEAREREARKASVAAADTVDVPTGEYPIVRELVAVA